MRSIDNKSYIEMQSNVILGIMTLIYLRLRAVHRVNRNEIRAMDFFIVFRHFL